jgi:hypothetical integral membrane protein (TIGR02206 family)
MTWQDYFAYDYRGTPFVLFGRAHLAVLAALFLFGIFVLRFRGADAVTRRRVRIALALLMLVTELSWHAWSYATGTWTLQKLLPLHACSVLVWVTIYTLITRDQATYEFVYLLGVAAPMQALLTPDAGPFGLPHFRAFQTLGAHGFIIIAVLFLTLGERMRPRPGAVRRVVLGTLVYMAAVTGVNLAVGSNYMYTLGKPPTASLLDAFGPWPWYLGPMIGLGILACLLMYLPFWWADRRRARAAVTAGAPAP